MALRMGDRGTGELTSTFTADLHHYCSAELRRVGTPGSESRRKPGGSGQQPWGGVPATASPLSSAQAPLAECSRQPVFLPCPFSTTEAPATESVLELSPISQLPL